MLVLTRKINQSISLGADIRITVLNVEGDRVSIGVEAPKAVRIFRSELIEGTKSVNRESLAAEFVSLKQLHEKTE